MDTINAGSSTLAFLLLTVKSARAIHQSLTTIKDAPRVVSELAQDVHLLQTVLQRLTQCSLDNAPSSTVVSLQEMLLACKTELSSIESRLAQFSTQSNCSRSHRVYKGILAVVKKEHLEDARNRIRDKTTQANLYLGLIQAQAISDTSSKIDTQASATTGILEKILGEVARLHTRLDGNAPMTDATPDYTASVVAEDLEAMTLCSELEDSISRLSGLVHHDGLTLDADDAEQIIDDLQRFIFIAKEKASSKCTRDSKIPTYTGIINEDSALVHRGLKLIEGLILSAPIVAINKSVPNSKQLLSNLPPGAIIQQKRVREEIDVEHGCLTVSINKRRRICQTSALGSPGNVKTARDVVANIMFRPSDSHWLFSVSVSQGQLFDRSIQSIPRISVCPIVPDESPVFRLVREGQLDAFRILLDQGKASIRDHDEQGMSLLHYAVTGSVEVCKFLIDSGADVDEMGEHTGTALSRIAGLGRHDTTQLLLENMADPTLSYPGWDNPLSTACSMDIPSVELFLKYGRHFAMHDLESSDMSGRTRLHQICMAESKYTNKREAVAMLIAAGANVSARITRSWSPEDHQTLGFTCLHSLVYTAHRTKDRDDLETLVFLIQQGASTTALDHHKNTVSMRAYMQSATDNSYSSKGSYRGDLWDAALVKCGYDLAEFRTSYPRVTRYNRSYTREDFERLWAGNESRCPYWDDKRYPETGGADDYWKHTPPRCNGVQFPDCEKASQAVPSPDQEINQDDLPVYAQESHGWIPSPNDLEVTYRETLGEAYENEYWVEEYEYEDWLEESESYRALNAEEFYDAVEYHPSPPVSEDGQETFRRLGGGQREEDDEENYPVFNSY